MVKLACYKTETYMLDDGFYIDIVDYNDTYSAFLYQIDYGIKELIFCMPKIQQTKSDFVNIVEMALINDNYMADYMDRFMD